MSEDDVASEKARTAIFQRWSTEFVQLYTSNASPVRVTTWFTAQVLDLLYLNHMDKEGMLLFVGDAWDVMIAAHSDISSNAKEQDSPSVH